MGKRFIVDTNVISDYVSENLPKFSLDFLDTLFEKYPTVSFITQIELLSYLGSQNEAYKQVSEICEIIGVNDEIIAETIKIRRGRKIKIPDAIIAATAISLNATLLTHNTKDFIGISNLELLDLHLGLDVT